MNLLPLRLSPDTDLRTAIEECLQIHCQASAFVLSGIGSLVQAKLRFAGMKEEATLAGPLEIISLAGSVSPNGAHLHMSVATHTGQVFGGHVCYGNTIRTTAEILIALLPEWSLSREHDPGTGYNELIIRRRE